MANAGDLKSSVSQETSRFESGRGHSARIASILGERGMQCARACGDGSEIDVVRIVGKEPGDNSTEMGSTPDFVRALEVDSTDGNDGHGAARGDGAQHFYAHHRLRARL